MLERTRQVAARAVCLRIRFGFVLHPGPSRGDSAFDDLDARIQSAEIIGVAGHGHPVDNAGHKYDRRIDDVEGGRRRTQLSRGARDSGVQRMDDNALGRHHTHEADLASWVSPRLGERAGRHMDVLRELQQPDHPPVGPIDRHQGARVEDYNDHRGGQPHVLVAGAQLGRPFGHWLR